MKQFVLVFIILLISAASFQPSAYAYSYGDPSEEKVAEAYKEMVVKLNDSPPDFEEADKIFGTVKEEIEMHMGSDAVQSVQSELSEEDKQGVIENMQKVLVLNISRRLENVSNNFEDYDTSKKLLAKANATYRALSPIVEEQDSNLDGEIKEAFESSLEALGNPGLFGVGEQKPDKEKFETNKEFILSSLQEQFQMKSLEVGHFSESASEGENAGQTEDWTDLSQYKNWIPILVLIVAIAGVLVYVMKKRKK
ncbi:hypothetical protein [Pseudalkalibacillus caeni]|uniref:Extracellular protein n=1 Tax=Exobacillus caeni TaxID=2574798 RepID=A0A5R9F6I7_9BACL|nr:hypothetical protein [Pseudalkalibacillus caeni]TLS39187.1 hypothetical protein FCL54_02425 [Pseudalkalibacillus caeni]